MLPCLPPGLSLCRYGGGGVSHCPCGHTQAGTIWTQVQTQNVPERVARRSDPWALGLLLASSLSMKRIIPELIMQGILNLTSRRFYHAELWEWAACLQLSQKPPLRKAPPLHPTRPPL